MTRDSYVYIYICVYMCIRLQRIRNVYWIRRVREPLLPWHLENLAYISERFPNASKSVDLNLNQSHLLNACNTGNHIDLCSVRQFCVSSIFTLQWGRKWHNSKFVGYFYAIRIPGSTTVGIFSRLFCTVISLADPSLMIPPLPPPPLLLHLPDKLADFLHHTTRNSRQNEKVNVLSLFHG